MMRSVKYLLPVVAGLAGLMPSGICAAQSESYELLQASQTVFRSLSQQLRPSLVRIETVGGAQPIIPLFIDDGES